MAKLDVVALSDAGTLGTGSLVGSSRPVSFGLSVTGGDGDPVEGLTKASFDVTLVAPVTSFVVDTAAFLELAEGMPARSGGGAAVAPKEDFQGFYVLNVEPRSEWKEGDYVFGLKVKRVTRGTPDRGQTLVKVHIA